MYLCADLFHCHGTGDASCHACACPCRPLPACATHATPCQAKLGSMAELERELDKYRRAAREAAEKEAAAKKSSGLWGYIAGSGSS